ncbi:phosphatases II [Basidiobolus meristosporus CBS 931.73]|uniref:Phosphatases II n=1 Tax=Basidiobolus meristosporus CBS 931.73 TaxID=1314790 RepID=A0A1Y1ZBF4_9FUNG|nr:phosphatases II [Basidiobolus meristosporus CBS 931.73]|eukprot:ORY07444.1 phosphatases II [Basidiobolus meristosporus CBS 931.73]
MTTTSPPANEGTKVGVVARTQFYVSLWYNKLLAQTLSPLSGWTWWNRVDKTVIIGALPDESLIRELNRTANVKYVVNMCREFDELCQLYKELDIEQVRLETEDFTTPSLENIRAGVEYIESCVKKNNGTIYVHCKAGRGRSATMVLCYLITRYELSPEKAQQILLKSRAQVDKHIHLNDVVQDYYTTVKDRTRIQFNNDE